MEGSFHVSRLTGLVVAMDYFGLHSSSSSPWKANIRAIVRFFIHSLNGLNGHYPFGYRKMDLPWIAHSSLDRFACSPVNRYCQLLSFCETQSKRPNPPLLPSRQSFLLLLTNSAWLKFTKIFLNLLPDNLLGTPEAVQQNAMIEKNRAIELNGKQKAPSHSRPLAAGSVCVRPESTRAEKVQRSSIIDDQW